MTEQIKPRVGERWRVTIEGEICQVYSDGSGLRIHRPGGDFILSLGEESSMVRLPDPEPEWQPGDLVIDAEKGVWERRTEPDVYGQIWCVPGDHENAYGEDAVVRPLRRLVVAE